MTAMIRPVFAIPALALALTALTRAPLAADSPVSTLPRLTQNSLSQPADVATILLAQGADETGDSLVVANRMAPDRKSPGVAFAMSALVPGAGEFWAGNKTRAAVFFGLEILGLGTKITWQSKGDDLEDDFRARADTTYDPWNYLAWRDSRNSRFSSITHALPCSAFVKAAPSSVPIPDAIQNCPGSDKQQFYELIGKYDQFVSGWEDVHDVTGNRVEFTEVDSAENFQSDTRLSYEVDRNESNKYLKRASIVTGLRLVNRVFSAIDAVRVARARNEGQSEALIDRRTRYGVAMGGSVGRTPMIMAYRPLY